MPVVLGVDPGINGAMVLMDDQLRIIWWADMPTLPGRTSTRRQINHAALSEMLRGIKIDQYSVCVEKQWPQPTDPVTTAAAIGGYMAGWRQLCACLGLPLTEVAPRRWQNRCLAGATGETWKDRSMNAAALKFPALPLTRPKGRKLWYDGRADAAWLAYYGLRYG